jgi:hypothetical protein
LLSSGSSWSIEHHWRLLPRAWRAYPEPHGHCCGTVSLGVLHCSPHPYCWWVNIRWLLSGCKYSPSTTFCSINIWVSLCYK